MMKLLRSYIRMYQNEFKGYNFQRFISDLLAGLTVTAVALPLALAFGESCGASAAAGLVTAIIAGIVISLLSGASFQISGPTGAMSAILISIVAQFQLNGVFVVTFLAGIILLIAALFKLGRLVSMIPRPVITGFTSGIAVIIALGQVDNFFGTVSTGENAISKLISYTSLGFKPNWYAVGIGLLVIAIMIIWPKKWNAKVPSSLIGIIVATIVSLIFGLDTKFGVATVPEIPKSIFLADRLNFATVEWARIADYLSPAVSIAALAMIESLLCGASASKMKNEKLDPDKELIAQGVGNLLIPFFGGVPATAAIARTSVAIKSGCQTRLTGVIHALGLLAAMFILGPIMSSIPLAALAGVLIVTAWRMNEWSEIKYLFSHKFRGAIGQYLVTMTSTVLFDLTIAILIGVAYSAMIFIYRCVRLDLECNAENSQARLSVSGDIFFINLGKIENTVENLLEDNESLIIDLSGVSVIDVSSAEYFLELEETHKNVDVIGATKRVKDMLKRAGVKLADNL